MLLINLSFPQFPKAGWNNIPQQPHQPQAQNADFFSNLKMFMQMLKEPVNIHEEEFEELIEDSNVLNGSDDLGDSVNDGIMYHNIIISIVKLPSFQLSEEHSLALNSLMKKI
jgi:hypothetical protein